MLSWPDILLIMISIQVYVSDRLADINSHEELKALYEEEVAKSKEHFHKAGRVHKYGSTVIWR